MKTLYKSSPRLSFLEHYSIAQLNAAEREFNSRVRAEMATTPMAPLEWADNALLKAMADPNMSPDQVAKNIEFIGDNLASIYEHGRAMRDKMPFDREAAMAEVDKVNAAKLEYHRSEQYAADQRYHNSPNPWTARREHVPYPQMTTVDDIKANKQASIARDAHLATIDLQTYAVAHKLPDFVNPFTLHVAQTSHGLNREDTWHAQFAGIIEDGPRQTRDDRVRQYATGLIDRKVSRQTYDTLRPKDAATPKPDYADKHTMRELLADRLLDNIDKLPDNKEGSYDF